jgi:hypothetical protein
MLEAGLLGASRTVGSRDPSFDDVPNATQRKQDCEQGRPAGTFRSLGPRSGGCLLDG